MGKPGQGHVGAYLYFFSVWIGVLLAGSGCTERTAAALASSIARSRPGSSETLGTGKDTTGTVTRRILASPASLKSFSGAGEAVSSMGGTKSMLPSGPRVQLAAPGGGVQCPAHHVLVGIDSSGNASCESIGQAVASGTCQGYATWVHGPVYSCCLKSN